MGTVADVLWSKGNGVHSIDASALVSEAIVRMASAGVGSLIVTEGEEILGVITDLDALRRVALEGSSSTGGRVSEQMTTRVLWVGPEADIEHCLTVMWHRGIRHGPVIDDGELVGLVSLEDLIRHHTRERRKAQAAVEE